ncbi:DUF6283 family protein [Streptomyces sp. NPDC088768]|uniref:DUF6283 family protein n=1 Tax=Streptomyces sp. NPDC088768 TaxID=3365894 RepID=UPI0037F35757
MSQTEKREALDIGHDRQIRQRLERVAAARGVTPDDLLAALNTMFSAGQAIAIPAADPPLQGPGGSAHVVRQRLADDVWGVTSVTSDAPVRARSKPCDTTEICPWRRDAPSGQFPAEAFVHSAPGNRHGGADGVFGCHSSTPRHPQACAGWLLAGADGNETVLEAMERGDVPRPTLPDGVDLYGSYAEMAIANGVDPDLPELWTQCNPVSG